MIKETGLGETPSILLVENFFDQLKRLVPVN